MKLPLPLFIALSSIIAGCASLNSVPQNAKDVDFHNKEEGRTGWSEYKDSVFFKNVDKQTAYLAAKSGLADAGFTIKKATYDKLTVIGEHGITLYDWNVIAGAYIKETPNGSYIKVIVEGSKDVGFWGDMTASSWTQDILKGARNYILTESQIENPNKKNFQQ